MGGMNTPSPYYVLIWPHPTDYSMHGWDSLCRNISDTPPTTTEQLAFFSLMTAMFSGFAGTAPTSAKTCLHPSSSRRRKHKSPGTQDKA